jgi:hypothetical protein
MPSNPKNTTSTVIPAMRYRDANAAIEWLCKAFGFEKHLVVPGENGTVAHAQLAFGNGMIMLGSAREDEFGQWVKAAAGNRRHRYPERLRHRRGCRCALCARQSGRRRDRHGGRRSGLRRSALFLP